MMITDPALERKQSFEDDHTIIPFADCRVNETYLLIDIYLAAPLRLNCINSLQVVNPMLVD